MKKLIDELLKYNYWANQQILHCLLGLPADLWITETPSSFSSIYKTVTHVGSAEKIWLRRVRSWQSLIVTQENNPQPQKLAFDSLEGDFKQISSQWMQTSADWVHLIENENLTDMDLLMTIKYSNSKGQQFNQPLYEIIMHLCNHGTYHRGQLVTMLHQLNIHTIPATDLIVFKRNGN
jgi:uncharacterized damage-inducible protein DinB